MKKYKIMGISVLAVFVIVAAAILSAGSMLVDSPIPVILATVDFIGTEQEFRDLVESTEEAKLFRKAFPETTTQYYLEIGKRTIVFLNRPNLDDATLHFKQYYDRTLSVAYWCDAGDERVFGQVRSVEDMRASGCFNGP